MISTCPEPGDEVEPQGAGMRHARPAEDLAQVGVEQQELLLPIDEEPTERRQGGGDRQ